MEVVLKKWEELSQNWMTEAILEDNTQTLHEMYPRNYLHN